MQPCCITIYHNKQLLSHHATITTTTTPLNTTRCPAFTCSVPRRCFARSATLIWATKAMAVRAVRVGRAVREARGSKVPLLHLFLSYRKMRFRERCKSTASRIRGGALRLPDEYMQVPSAAWETLAKINEAGLLTTNSQAASEPNQKYMKTYSQRAYIEGLMRRCEARRFVERFNLETNMMAFVVPLCGALTDPLGKWLKQNAVMHVTKHRARGQPATMLTAVTDRKTFRDVKTRGEGDLNSMGSGLDKEEDVVLIVCIDPVWDRIAFDKQGTGLFDVVLRTLQKIRK